MPKAVSLAAVLKETFGIKPEMIEGSGGVFEVVADGKLIFSKKSSGRFPEHYEVLDSLAALKK